MATENLLNLVQHCPILYLIKSFHHPLSVSAPQLKVQTKSHIWCVTLKSWIWLLILDIPEHIHPNTVSFQAGTSEQLYAYFNNAAFTWNIWELPYRICFSACGTSLYISSDNSLSFGGEFDFWKQLIVTWSQVCWMYMGDVWGKEWGVKTMWQCWFAKVAHRLLRSAVLKEDLPKVFWTLGQS